MVLVVLDDGDDDDDVDEDDEPRIKCSSFYFRGPT